MGYNSVANISGLSSFV